MSDRDPWLALVIGNSRLHWALFEGEILEKTWETPHHATPVGDGKLAPEILPPSVANLRLPLYLASVVPGQTQLWQGYAHRQITLDRLPLNNTYPTLGIDRALAVLGAGMSYQFPVLVVDGGTALTLTGVDGDRALVGGAILPGLGLQRQSLATQTGALPRVDLPSQLPPRWANSTPEAIQSGIIYSVIAGIADYLRQWWQRFPDSAVVFTGGDGELLLSYLQATMPAVATPVAIAPHLIFEGMRWTRQELMRR